MNTTVLHTKLEQLVDSDFVQIASEKYADSAPMTALTSDWCETYGITDIECAFAKGCDFILQHIMGILDKEVESVPQDASIDHKAQVLYDKVVNEFWKEKRIDYIKQALIEQSKIK